MTRVNRTTPDNVPSYRLQLARPRQRNCLDRFEIDHAFYLTHAQTPAALACMEKSGTKFDIQGGSWLYKTNKNETIINIMKHTYYKTESKHGLVTQLTFIILSTNK